MGKGAYVFFGGADVHGVGSMSHQFCEVVFCGIGQKGLDILVVNVFCFATAGIAGEEGKGVGVDVKGIFTHGKIAFS